MGLLLLKSDSSLIDMASVENAIKDSVEVGSVDEPQKVKFGSKSES